MENYHSRWSDPGYLSSNAPKNIPVPLYDNQLHQLRASHLLIVAEMGVGDEVMYLSGIRGLIDAGSTVSVSCDPRLAPALQRTFPEAEWISRQHFEETRSDLDCAKIDQLILAADIPRFVSNRDFGWNTAKRLQAPLQQIDHWQEWLSTLPKGPKVGISWRGGGEEVVMRRRSVTLLRMLELVRGYDLQLINLQYDTSEAELEVIVDTSNVHAIPGLDARNDLEGLPRANGVPGCSCFGRQR